MNPLKQLAGQTAVYGLSSIVGRFLNYLLVPLHTARFVPEQFGIITEMYAYVAFLTVLLTYGMETAYFRFSTKKEYSSETVYQTALNSIIASSVLFIFLISLFSSKIAAWLQYPENSEYVVWFAFILGLDAMASIPLAKLRANGKALYFAGVNLASIITNIGLNVFFIYFCMGWAEEGVSNFFTKYFYDPSIGIGYVFIANLVASIVKFILLLPLLIKQLFKFDFSTWKTMIWYAFPLLIAGLAGIANETIDRILLKNILSPVLGFNEALRQVGIYGAVYKISIIITLFIQAFRYAAEPFFFHHEKHKNAPFAYAVVMNFFVIVCVSVFMGVMLYIDIVKQFLRQKEYWEGLHVVPVLLMANIFLGIYYNLSAWYKLSGKTRFGAYFSIIGALITLTLNLLWIPEYGYTGAAWAT
ncbi:MAG: polysaccharide biosynthesis protein, partial [Bacteroidetes bacterium]